MEDWEMMLITVILSVLLLMVMHLLRIAFFRGMTDWVRQVLGVLGLALPLSMLFYKWQSWRELLALWLVIAFGGGILLLVGLLENLWNEHLARVQSEERERSMMQATRNDHEQSKPA